MFCKYCGTEITDSTRPCPRCGNYQGAGVDGMDHNPQKQSSYQQPNYQQPNYQQPNYQQPNYQQPNYQQPNYQQPNYQQPNYQQPNYQQPNYQQPNYQQPYYQQPNYQQYPYPVQPQAMYPYPMKWYKAQIYVLMFLSAFSGLIYGIMLFSGSLYQGMADAVYAMIPGMKGLDVFVGILSLASIPIALITRQKLANFKHDSLKWVIITYVFNGIISLVYVIGAIISLSNAPFFGYESYYLEQLFQEFISQMVSIIIFSVVTTIIMIVLNNIYYKKRASLFIN